MHKKRKSGSGTLRKRTDGRWEARVVIGYDEKGKPITKNVTANEKSKCLEKLEKLKEEINFIKEKKHLLKWASSKKSKILKWLITFIGIKLTIKLIGLAR